MALEYLFLGIFVKLITGLDDTLTNVPVLSAVTRTRTGKIAFSLGTLIAIGLAIAISIFFAEILSGFPYYRYVSAGLLFLLAILVFFDILTPRRKTRTALRVKKLKISAEKFTRLVSIGFLASFASVIDDIIAYLPLFISSFSATAYAIMGILAATLFEIIVVIYFSGKIAKLPYKSKIATAGLIVLGILILTGII